MIRRSMLIAGALCTVLSVFNGCQTSGRENIKESSAQWEKPGPVKYFVLDPGDRLEALKLAGDAVHIYESLEKNK